MTCKILTCMNVSFIHDLSRGHDKHAEQGNGKQKSLHPPRLDLCPARAGAGSTAICRSTPFFFLPRPGHVCWLLLLLKPSEARYGLVTQLAVFSPGFARFPPCRTSTSFLSIAALNLEMGARFPKPPLCVCFFWRPPSFGRRVTCGAQPRAHA